MLVPLANQFSLMQQQMFEQFQQTIMLMAQMFSTLHKEQLGFVRQELDRMHLLMQELQALQAELARRSQAAPRPAASEPVKRPPQLFGTISSTLFGTVTSTLLGTADDPTTARALIQHQPLQEEQKPPTAPSSDMPGSGAGTKGDGGQGGSPPGTSAGIRPASEVPSPVVPSGNPGPPGSPSGGGPTPRQPTGTPPPATANQSEEEIHSWLCQRIASLQQEHQTRWQKVMGYLLGKRPTEPIP
jgi:hypothetical protein